MMGPRQEARGALFYEFSLEDHVPTDHLLRSIDRFVDLSGIRAHLAPFHGSTGRPSVDPELMIRMLLVGYCFGIRSERRLCEEVHLNLAYRWFCRLDLADRIPDHSTFSKNRHGRFRESDLLRHVFETVLRRCIKEGLASGESFAVDASLIEADANKQRSTPRAEWDPAAIDPEDAPRAVREYLDVLDDAAFGAPSDVTPKFTSPSDPAAQWTGAHKGHAFLAYATNYLIDTDNAVIVDVETTRAAPAHSQAMGLCRVDEPARKPIRQRQGRELHEDAQGRGCLRHRVRDLRGRRRRSSQLHREHLQCHPPALGARIPEPRQIRGEERPG